MSYRINLICTLSLTALSGCATAIAADYKSELSVSRGEYLTTILGCEGCHTEGALEGRPYGNALAGSRTGIAYSDPTESNTPGVVFPKNLTPHKTMGIGRWSAPQIARAIRSGINHQGGEVISVMPWNNYSQLNDKDTDDIVRYLQSLDEVAYEIPPNIPLGEPITHRYIRIGIYSFEPFFGDSLSNSVEDEL